MRLAWLPVLVTETEPVPVLKILPAPVMKVLVLLSKA